jgi:glycosyltransferase involved in cell wall biosynthesis
LTGVWSRLGLLTRWLLAYPPLLYRYLRLPPHELVIVAYPGAIDVLVLWPFARLRGTPIVWDVFLSLYDTIVRDRRLLRRWFPLAWGIYSLEWLAARAASRPFLDTEAHARYFSRLFRLDQKLVGSVPVGVEDSAFALDAADESHAPSEGFTVLFYGQFIPLHGLDVVVEAAALLAREARDVQWVIIGHGQEADRIDAHLAALELTTVTRVKWVDYNDLARWIRKADVCLGIFGTTEKAHNVVPNKVYQALAMGRRVITSDTNAQRELLSYGAAPWLTFVPAGDAVALAHAILRVKNESKKPRGTPPVIGADKVGERLRDIVRSSTAAR